MRKQPKEMASDSVSNVSCRNGSPPASAHEPCRRGQSEVASLSPCKMRDAADKTRHGLLGAQFLAAVMVVLLGLLLTVTVKGKSNDLFSEVEPAAARIRTRTVVSTEATTIRHRVVTMSLERLQRARAAVLPRRPVRTRAVSPDSANRDAAPTLEAALTLNLFENVVFTAIVERTAPTFSGGYSISGRLVGKPLGMLTIVVNGETVAGSVRTLGGVYQIRSLGGGQYVISEVEEPPLKCEVLEPDGE